MRYVVTGAAGFVGSHLCEALAAAGHSVVGMDSFTDYYDTALKEQNADLLDAAGCDLRTVDLAEAKLDFARFDGVFHLAAQPGVRSFGDVFPVYLRNNVLVSQRVFEAAARPATPRRPPAGPPRPRAPPRREVPSPSAARARGGGAPPPPPGGPPPGP